MSSRQYTVTVKLKDDGTLAKLQALGGQGASGNKAGNVAAALGGANSLAAAMNPLQALQKLGAAQLLKLGGIAGGIATIATYTIKSSATLQSVFKLWDTTAMLVFKPLGDFIGMALRPLTILMLQYAIGFYKVAGPWFLKNGVAFGNWLAEQQSKTNQLADTQAKQTAEAFQGLQQWLHDQNAKTVELRDKQSKEFADAIDGIGKAWDGFTGDLSNKLIAIPNTITAIFGNFAGDLWQKLTNIPNAITSVFGDFTSNVWSALTSIPGMIVDVFTGLASDLGSKLAGIPQAIWDAIMRVIGSLNPFGGLGGTTPSALGTLNSPQARTQMAVMADARSV